MNNKIPLTQPKTSIIILNYFGEKVITETINSVLNQNYPKDKYEILIPDNASKDKSLEILNNFSKKYKNIKILPLNKNYGFAGGNGKAIKHAKGEYIILLNNDCLVDKNWLKNLITCADKDPQIFSVSSKVLIYPKYFTVTFKSTDNLKSCKLFNTKLLRFGKETYLELPFKKENNLYSLDIPFEEKSDNILQICLEFIEKNINIPKLNEKIEHTYDRNKKSNTVSLFINTNSSTIKKKSFNKIQNAGSLVFHDGYGRDIGATVQNQKGDYERDFRQYDYDREVYSINYRQNWFFNRRFLYVLRRYGTL
ncbi:MAG: Glycosyl transferase family 2 [Candidatus Shapirobacteria bacterium GW2011_GWE1_38_10]|uniref:Glycosyl transferase family 2 n=1 Tax=Candidatus Shapirobacteria bacterium GW2011_GWE1_38_10 TaxID=1618488 RepID=A0A0G0L792_9BACT|nr:MAG: Glycosyl transferase family 2 [Candidatus Shapirobacteria bacterium GW2011_GWE1_38_10]